MESEEVLLVQITAIAIVFTICLGLAVLARRKRLLSHLPNSILSGDTNTLDRVKWYYVIAGFLYLQATLIASKALKNTAIDYQSAGWLSILPSYPLAFFLVSIFAVDKKLKAVLTHSNWNLKPTLIYLLFCLPFNGLINGIAKIITSQVFYSIPVERQMLDVAGVSGILLFSKTFEAIVISGFNEEVLFRGLLQNFFTKWMHPFSAIFLVSAVFAYFHYQTGYGISNIPTLCATFSFSMCVGYLYHRSGSLLSCMVFHATNNTLSAIGPIFSYLTT